MNPDLRADVTRAYDEHLRDRPLEASLAATVAYFATLAIVRVYTTAMGGSNAGFVSIGGVHIHHMVFGIVALLVAGVFALDDVFRIARAVLFGIGAALVLDEFALLVFLRDVYWLPQGSISIVALAIGLIALVVNMWRGRWFFADVAKALRRRPQG
jgi:lysyl-tRNA synthetase class 2